MATLVAAACDEPPETQNGLVFTWHSAFSELPSSVYSTCSLGEDVAAVGGHEDLGFLLLWNRREWFQAELPEDLSILRSCWFSPSGTLYVVGENRAAWTRGPDGSWLPIPLSEEVGESATLTRVLGSSGDNVFIVGGTTASGSVVIVHYDGDRWSRADASRLPRGYLYGLWMSGSDDLWAVGTAGAILHFDGRRWQAVPSGTEETLRSISGSGTDDVFAVGGSESGVILRWDGTEWSDFAATPEPLGAVFTEPLTALFTAGEAGYTARFRRSDGVVKAPAPVELFLDPTLSFQDLQLARSGFSRALFASGFNRELDSNGAVFSTSRRFEGDVLLLP